MLLQSPSTRRYTRTLLRVIAASVIGTRGLLLVSKRAAPDVFFLLGGKPKRGEAPPACRRRAIREARRRRRTPVPRGTSAGRNQLSRGSGADELVAPNDKVDRIRCGPGRDRVRADAVDRVSGDCEIVRRTRTTRG